MKKKKVPGCRRLVSMDYSGVESQFLRPNTKLLNYGGLPQQSSAGLLLLSLNRTKSMATSRGGDALVNNPSRLLWVGTCASLVADSDEAVKHPVVYDAHRVGVVAL